MSPAGPYPTKVMHEALKARVTTLEAGSSGESIYLGLPSLAHPGPSNEVGNLAQIRLSWRRRSVHVAGFRLVGNIPMDALAGIGLTQGGNLSSEEFSWYPGYPYQSVTRRVVQQGSYTFTEFLLSHQPIKTDAYLTVSFAANRPYRLSATPSYAPPGVSITQTDAAGNAVAGYAYIDILSTQLIEVPTMPVPSIPAYGGDGVGSDSSRHLEVVWPESGAPYLHAYQAQDADGNQANYHLPFTAGLPQ